MPLLNVLVFRVRHELRVCIPDEMANHAICSVSIALIACSEYAIASVKEADMLASLPKKKSAYKSGLFVSRNSL